MNLSTKQTDLIQVGISVAAEWNSAQERGATNIVKYSFIILFNMVFIYFRTEQEPSLITSLPGSRGKYSDSVIMVTMVTSTPSNKQNWRVKPMYFV